MSISKKDLQEQINELNKQIEEKDATIAGFELHLELWKHIAITRAKQIDYLECQTDDQVIEDMKEQYEDLEDRYDELEVKYDLLEDTYKKLDDETRAKDEEIMTLISRLDYAEASNKHLREKRDELQKRLDNFKIHEYGMTLSEIRQHQLEDKKYIEDLTKENKALENDYKKASEANARLFKYNKNQSKTISEMTDVLIDLRNTNDELKYTLNSIKKTYDRARTNPFFNDIDKWVYIEYFLNHIDFKEDIING